MFRAARRPLLRVLRGVLGYAVDDGRIARNPANGIKVPRTKGTPRQVLSLPELRTFAAALNERERGVALVLAYPAFAGPSWPRSTSGTSSGMAGAWS